MTASPRAAVADSSLRRPDWTIGQSRNPNLLWLDKNENCDPEFLALVAKCVSGIGPEALSTYPDTAPLYQKLAKWVGVDPHNLLLAAGSDGVIRSVFEAYISPGDTVIITAPTFAMYDVYCRMYGARMIARDYRSTNVGPTLDAGEIIDAIRTERPRLVCLPNPDSPTGTVFSAADLRSIIAAAGHANAIMLIDEAYYPFHTETAVPWIAEFPHLVVARSTGKAWGMAGLRIGYAIASPEVAAALHQVRPMYECSTIGAAAFEAMLDHVPEMQASVARLEAGKADALAAMERMGLHVLHGQGNFLHVAFGRHAAEVHIALAEICYYRADFSHPSLKGFSRFSATTSELFRPMIKKIEIVVGGGHNG